MLVVAEVKKEFSVIHFFPHGVLEGGHYDIAPIQIR